MVSGVMLEFLAAQDKEPAGSPAAKLGARGTGEGVLLEK